MRTSDLIDVLTTVDSAPVRVSPTVVRVIPGVVVGAAASAIILGFWLGFQPLGPAMHARWFWMKGGYGAAAALAGLLMAIPLARPGGRSHWTGFILVAAAFVAVWTMAIRSALNAGSAAEPPLWLGHTWMVCPWRILALSTPIWIGSAVALRAMAPTRLAAAGAAMGLLAGGLSVMIYGLYCQETAAPFVAVWYSLGITASTIAGSLLGPRLLKW